VIKLSLEGQGVSSIRRVDPRKYAAAEYDIVHELRRRAIEMAREQQKQQQAPSPNPEDKERDGSSGSSIAPHQLPDDSYKVILKYKDVDGEECTLVVMIFVSLTNGTWAFFPSKA
jgi:hypothetical protein